MHRVFRARASEPASVRTGGGMALFHYYHNPLHPSTRPRRRYHSDTTAIYHRYATLYEPPPPPPALIYCYRFFKTPFPSVNLPEIEPLQ